ncbi:helix-turn-helix domain-containing protein [Spirosoma taeanense]|nr:response regulator transcription factor [Spirosoma taeanense]
MNSSKPEHPLICVIDYSQSTFPEYTEECSFVFDFYSIILKRNMGYKFHYGQTTYDFDEGVMSFVAPGQVIRIENSHVENRKCNGYILLFHPDFLWEHSLHKNITQLDYFGYSVNEALFLSDKEEKSIIQIFKNIQQEYHSNIDRFSHDIIITQIELLLKYSDRFYHRQFLTRRKPSNQLLTKVEDYLNEYFANDDLLTEKGIPTVQQVAEAVFVSPNYLSTLLKSLIGKNTQTLIQEKLLEKAKQKLSTTQLTVSEIAYQLGFEHSQSFSKFFKGKLNQSPIKYRQSFN